MPAVVTSPEGGEYRKVGRLAPSRAARLVVEPGARVAWDACGCDGFCGYDWLSTEQVRGLSAAGNPRIKRARNASANALWEYRDDADRPLIIAEGGIRWGGQLADRPRHP